MALTCFGDGNNRRTYHITVHCFSLQKMCCTLGNTQKFLVCSLNRVQLVLNRNGRKDGGQQYNDHTRSM